jgi:membrane dipeptidase
VTGSARHVGIGSDLDGCFGTEQTPRDLETIFDLTRLPALLAERGYSAADIQAILSGNFLRKLAESLPAGDVLSPSLNP